MHRIDRADELRDGLGLVVVAGWVGMVCWAASALGLG